MKTFDDEMVQKETKLGTTVGPKGALKFLLFSIWGIYLNNFDSELLPNIKKIYVKCLFLKLVIQKHSFSLKFNVHIEFMKM